MVLGTLLSRPASWADPAGRVFKFAAAKHQPLADEADKKPTKKLRLSMHSGFDLVPQELIDKVVVLAYCHNRFAPLLAAVNKSCRIAGARAAELLKPSECAAPAACLHLAKDAALEPTGPGYATLRDWLGPNGVSFPEPFHAFGSRAPVNTMFRQDITSLMDIDKAANGWLKGHVIDAYIARARAFPA